MNDSVCNFCGCSQQPEPIYHAFKHWPQEWYAVLLVIIVVFCLICYNWRWTKRVITFKVLGWFALAVFSLGFMVYTVGSVQTGGVSIWDAVYTVPSAIISSLGMFVYQDDISELSSDILKDSFFMAMYSIAHFLAASITSFFLIRLIGMRLFYLLDLFFLSLRDKRTSLYVFWGINPQSVTLAESVYAKKESRIVFVNTVEQETENDRDVSIRSLFDIIKVRDEAHERICNINADIVNCHAKFIGGGGNVAMPTYSPI